ncbi:unnamed protein product [Lathyrus sativus]|nr:unnamed protein product [Lathyrus sativus]
METKESSWLGVFVLLFEQDCHYVGKMLQVVSVLWSAVQIVFVCRGLCAVYDFDGDGHGFFLYFCILGM